MTVQTAARPQPVSFWPTLARGKTSLYRLYYLFRRIERGLLTFGIHHVSIDDIDDNARMKGYK